MHAMSRTDENTRDKFADAGILVRYKRGYGAKHLTLPYRDLGGAGRVTGHDLDAAVLRFANAVRYRNQQTLPAHADDRDSRRRHGA